jgi:hypothetical protein
MYYIQRRDKVAGNWNVLETVDEFETRREARAMLAECQMADCAEYYISQRACKDWHNRSAGYGA